MRDLVLCTHDPSQKRYLFIAPNSSGLCKGDKVKVETVHGIQPATVINVLPELVGSEEYHFILDCCGATEPLKRVLAKEVYTDLAWDIDDYHTLATDLNELFMPFQ